MRRIFSAGTWVLILAFILYGCAGPGKPVIGQQRIVERSAKEAPEWISWPFVEQEGVMYFSGAVKGVADYAVGLRQAKKEAEKNVYESIETKARVEFVENTRGSNMSQEDLGKFVQDGIATITENIKAQGILPSEMYWEKVEETTEYGVKYFYNCYQLIQLSVEDYKKARRRAIEDLAKKAREENNKAAEEQAMKLLEKL